MQPNISAVQVNNKMEIEYIGNGRNISKTDLNFEKIEIENDSLVLEDNLIVQQDNINHKRIKDMTFEIENLPLYERNSNINQIISSRSDQHFKNINSLIFEFEEL